MINDPQVLYDYMLSDHKPLSIRFSDLFPCDSHKPYDYENAGITLHCWDKLDDLTRLHYAAYIDQLLQNVLPVELLECLASDG